MSSKFSNIKAGEADVMDLEQSASFMNGYQQIVLQPGTELWRFVGSASTTHLGAFWMKPETMNEIMSQMKFAHNYSKQFVKEFIRNNLAILGEWSDLTFRQRIVINKEIIAYKGIIGRQQKWAKTNENIPFDTKGREVEKMVESRLGGYTQYVIPRLRGKFRENEYVTITYYSKV